MSVDPGTLSVESLEAEITTLAASIAVATWRWLKLLAEFDHRAPWGNWGLASCAHWLNWKCGVDPGAAREKMRVAHALEQLPKIDAAFAAGELSYSKVRAMTRVATTENEDYLLSIARHGTAAHMEKLVRGYRRTQRLQAARTAYAERMLTWTHEEDGSITLRARLPAEQGELVLKALQAAVTELRAEREGRDRGSVQPTDVSAETPSLRLRPEPDSFDPAECVATAWRADALCHVAEQFLANETVPARQAERFQVMVHVGEAMAQARDDTESASGCRIDGGPALAEDTARRIACDAAVVTLHEDAAGNVLDIGRRSRTIPPAIRRALDRRDGGCRFPGCLNHRFVDAHHIRHWADGGPTSMDNLLLLCRHHHRLLHEFGFSIERRDDGRALFFRPDGGLIPEAPIPARPSCDVSEVARDCGAHVSAETCVPNWDGEPLDLHDAVQALVFATEGSYHPPRWSEGRAIG
jgi:hypothetical protein